MKDSLQLLRDFTQKFSAPDGEDASELVTHVVTDPSALLEIYGTLPGKFPKLFEELLLSYRWSPANIGRLRLLANPPGNGYSGLLEEITKDKIMYKVCTANGYLQFALGGDGSYDPICFDLKKRSSTHVAVVRLDHEDILCRERIRQVEVVAPSFEEFVQSIVSGTSNFLNPHNSK